MNASTIRKTPRKGRDFIEETLVLVANARFLSERLYDGHANDCDSNCNSHVRAWRLNRWCEIAANGHEDKFQRRLAWEGSKGSDIWPQLDGTKKISRQELPTWGRTLARMLACLGNQLDCTMEENRDCLDAEEPLPFEDVWLPVVLFARGELTRNLGNDVCLGNVLSERAYGAMERALLARLVDLAKPTLLSEFNRTQRAGRLAWICFLPNAVNNASSKRYQAFCDSILADGFIDLFHRYPVLARFIAIMVDDWVASTAMFIRRVKKDWLENDAYGPVMDIEPSLSDFHRGGESVLLAMFASGIRLVYKPRNLGIDIAYNQFLEWCNARSGLPKLRTLQVFDHGDYGWVEYVQAVACDSKEEASSFYFNTGMLLSILYLLRATDCHHENVIASGDQLVLVDVESLLNPVPRMIDASPIAADLMNFDESLSNSVLQTGLLPSWTFSYDFQQGFDASGIGGELADLRSRQVVRWQSINTDGMRLVLTQEEVSPDAGSPTNQGRPVSAEMFVDDLIRGFQAMYLFLMTNVAVPGRENALEVFRDREVRFVFRPTHVYGTILNSGRDSRSLSDGVEWSLRLEALSRAFLVSDSRPAAWPIFHDECRSMENLDIPYFATSTESDDLRLAGTTIDRYFTRTGFELVWDRAHSLSDSDLSMQVAMIRGAFIARQAQDIDPDSKRLFAASSDNLWNDLEPVTPLSQTELLEQTQAIASEIRKQAIVERNGDVQWLGFSYFPKAGRFQFQPLGVNLYDGVCGVMVFLAALDVVSNSTSNRDLILGAYQPFRKRLIGNATKTLADLASQLGIGAATGLGSIVYSLATVHRMLGNSTMLDDALLASRAISPSSIANDRSLDVLSGAAGAILALLRLYRESGEAEVLNSAIACGWHLVEQRSARNSSLRAWTSICSMPLTGFSHGAAGISYALLQLFAVTSIEPFLHAAREGIAFEDESFSAEVGNWYDFRSAEPSLSSAGWCHGAPGIGLARLGSVDILGIDSTRRDIETAIDKSISRPDCGVDHVCCGNAGIAEVLLVASQKLNRPDLKRRGEERLARIIRQASSDHGFRLWPNNPGRFFNPAFFQGLAGIGYTNLRMLTPLELPSILLWE